MISALAALSEEDVVAFARAELSGSLGEAPRGVFVAGGAFKALLHGRPPRDLDLWAESDEARSSLVAALSARGERLAPSRGADRFRAGGRLIDVSRQIEPLERRLERFDLGLSCVGVAFRTGGAVPLVHPLARASVAAREVLLVRILYPDMALATLVRARRYADDLGYEVPASLEREVWARFDGLPEGERSEVLVELERHYGDETWGVPGEALARASRR